MSGRGRTALQRRFRGGIVRREGSLMFGLRYDKVEWFVGLLLITAMALAAFA